MSNFANFVYMGQLYSTLPDISAPAIKGMYDLMFRPNLPIVEEDCGTTIGTKQYISSDIVGKVELLPNNVPYTTTIISYSQPAIGGTVDLIVGDNTWSTIGQIISVNNNLYTVHFLSGTTHIIIFNFGYVKNAKPGTYFSSGAVVNVDNNTVITPQRETFLLQSDATTIRTRNVGSCTSVGGVCRTCLFGTLNRTDYPTLDSAPKIGTNYKFDYTSSTTEFLSYVADTYSGNLLGFKSYFQTKLPLPYSWYAKSISDSKKIAFTRKVIDSGYVGVLEIDYAQNLSDNVECVLFLLAQYIVGYYVNN